MVVIEHGVIANGGIALEKPLALPDGARVIVRVETAPVGSDAADGSVATDLPRDLEPIRRTLPFIGQWADRTDLGDSTEHVHEERTRWQQRPFRRD